MTDKEFFLETMKDEWPRFERTLRAVPQDKLDWRPHERTRSAWELLTTTFGMETATFPIICKTGKVDFTALGAPDYKTVQDVMDSMKKSFEETQSVVAAMSEEDWNGKAMMMSGEKVEWETTKGKMVWGLLFDLIHHRGQLSVYLRPMGGKVPSIYGPSGDTEG